MIDVGINKQDGQLCGDIHTNDVLPFVSHITPVPGGVGPLTILSLAENLLTAVERQVNKL
jgi:methylenetetrahydrofolate dehydrogenase (NADP+)/methenyltetrahydrofolate cyclohydrolase